MARTSRTVPRIGRIGSSVPSALIFWITVIILGQFQPGVEGICSIPCANNMHCEECITTLEKCATFPYDETIKVGTSLFNVTVITDQSTENITIRISSDLEDFAPMIRIDGLQVILDKELDYETVQKYNFDIDCNDGTGWSSTPESLSHILEVEDENEYSPDFGVSIIYASIVESAETGIVLITSPDDPIQAFDADTKDFGFEYYILEDVPFNVTGTASNGCELGEVFLRLNGTVDFEDQESYNFTLIAEDGCTSGFDSREGNVTVIVQVIDTDDEPPVFSQDNYDVTIPERNSTFVYTGLSASDGDSFNADLRYSFIGQRGEWSCLYFLEIDSVTADVTIRNELDFETSPGTCIITVQAVQLDDLNKVGTTTLTVTVMNVEECPSFISQSYSGQLTEDDPFVITDDGSERLIMGMTDEDMVFGGPSYIEPNDTIELVEMNMPVGTKTRFFLIKFLDPASIVIDTQIQISLSNDTADMVCDRTITNVTVRLMPDGLAPNFTQSSYLGNVPENASEGTDIIQVKAFNSEMNSVGIVYRLQMASDGGEDVFSVDAESGVVSVVMENGLDAEKVEQYTLVVEAVDERGTYYRYSITSVIIDVTDVNEHAPTFAGGVVEVDIEEEVPTDSSVYTVQANDLDVDAILEYFIRETAPVPFKINQETGEISTNGRLDRDEGTTAYNITVVVTDGTNEDDRLVTITLIDINDNAPEFTEGSQELSVSENTTDTETLQVIEATDMDEGVNAEIVYVLESPDDGLFSVDNETGMLYANGPFDYEAVKEYTLVISASDSKFSTLTTVTVTITDVNDNAPVFISFCLNIEVLEDVGVDNVICTVGAVDDDGDRKDTVTYSLDPSSGTVPFSVDSSGNIITDGTLDRETEDNYIITIIAEDSGEPPLSSNTTITVIVLDVNDNDPKFAETSLQVRLQKDDLADPPVLLSSVKATDADLAPWNITQCEKTSGEDSFVVLTGQDGSCEIYAYEELSIGTYSVSFYAFNPDNRGQSENVTLRVDIRDTVCDVTFENEADYDVIVLESELDTDVPVVTLNVTSNCNSDDIVFNISSQTYWRDLDARTSLPSTNFTINDQTGEIFPTDIVMEGKYILLVRAYNQSDPEVSEPTEVTIVVTGENTAPEFGKTNYTVITITTDSMIEVIELGPEVTDVDTPSFANGELIFSKVSETDGSGSSTDYFEVSSSGIVTTTQTNLNLIKSGTFEVDVMVIDGAIEPLNDTAVVIINVEIDDQSNPVVSPPMISKDCPDLVEIEEETDFPVVCRVSGSSASDDKVVFGLESASEDFDIGTNSGEITTTKTFDYEKDEHSYTLLVYAEGTTSKLRNYTSFTVIVTDINDNPPVFPEIPYSFSIEENAHGSEECLTFVGLIQSTDADSEINQFVTYTTDKDDFEVRDNNLMAVDCISRNDVEYATGEVEVTITALNNGTNVDQTTDVVVIVEVEDINDHAPEFINDDFSVSLEDLSTDLVIFQGKVNDADKGPFNNEVVFSLADGQDDVIYSLFHMSSDGALTVRDIGISDEYRKKKYEVIIMATDMGQPPLNSSRIVTVNIGIVDVTKPYFPPSERNQTIKRKENQVDCYNITYPETCNETTYLEVNYTLAVEPISGQDLFSINETDTALYLCWKELDREVSSSYTVTLTASYENSSMCKPTNVTTSNPTRKRRDVQELGTNTVIVTITVTDDPDSPPSFQFPSNTIGTAYYLAAIDSTQFGSPVYTVIAEDKDASWEFMYTLTSLSEDGVEGPKNTIVIDPSDGRITTNSLLYPSLSDAWSWEWEKENNFRASRTQDPYNVTVCDTSPGAIAQCDTAPLTFKILLSFEHIIIRFNKPVATILPQQNDIISCIAKTLDPTNMLELNLQFLSPVKEDDQDMTDMWLYGVDLKMLPSSPYLKFDDFMTMWDKPEDLEDCNGGDTMEPRRLQLSTILPGMSTTSAIEAWVPIALGIIVFIGNLICIILLLVSWKTMHLESGRELARQLTVHDEEKGIANPVFEYDDDADDDVEIMATEAEEGATGSEEPLITTVYLTDGKTQSTIAMTANDEPTDVEKAVGSDDDRLNIPEREYDFQEKEMDFDFEYDDKVDLNTVGNDVSEAAETTESSSTDPTILLPLDDNDKDTKDKDGAKEESEREDQEEESLISKPKPPAVLPKPTDHANNGSAADPILPDVDYETETKNRDQVEDEEKKIEEKATPGTPDSGMETDEAFKDSDVPPPPPVPIIQELPLEDQVEDHPLPPPPPPLPIVPPIDYADGKTVTFGGETVVGEGAGDGGSICTDQDTASEASSRSGTAEDRSNNRPPTRRGPSLSSEIDLIAASLDRSSSGNQNVGLVASPQSVCESEGESIGYLDDESLISVSEIGVTSL